MASTRNKTSPVVANYQGHFFRLSLCLRVPPLVNQQPRLWSKPTQVRHTKDNATTASRLTPRQPGYFTDAPDCFILPTQFAFCVSEPGHRKPQRLVLADGAFWFLLAITIGVVLRLCYMKTSYVSSISFLRNLRAVAAFFHVDQQIGKPYIITA